MNYKEYMLSELWRITRGMQLHEDKHTCQMCGRKQELRVHHLTYENLGQEKDGDLQTLCVRCHNDVHAERGQRADEFMILNQTPITQIEYENRSMSCGRR